MVLTSLMLTDMLPRTVFTRGEADRRLRDFKPDALLNDRLPSEVVARVILEQRCAWVRSDAIREWAVNKRVSYRNIINSGIRMGYVTNLAREGEASRYSGTYDMLGARPTAPVPACPRCASTWASCQTGPGLRARGQHQRGPAQARVQG